MNPDQAAVMVDDAWQRIAGLKLRLCGSLTFHIHQYRGQPWLIIADQRGGNYFRCSTSKNGWHAVETIKMCTSATWI
jgi:hypothetical protein